MMLPTFFIIGAAKAGTTSLSSLIDEHPEAGIVPGKEPHFFSYDENYARGIGWYASLFATCAGARAIGDASTSYSRIRAHPVVVDRLRYHLVKAKFVYMVRHPLRRMESAYVEHVSTSHRPIYRSINDAVRRERMIVDSSRYWEVVQEYWRHFGESSVKIVLFEDYIERQEDVFRDVCSFIGVDASYKPRLERERRGERADRIAQLKRIGRGNVVIDMNWDPGLRDSVLDQIRDDAAKLLAYCGRRDVWQDITG